MFTHSKISVDEIAEHIVEQRRRNPQDRNGRGWQSKAYQDQPFDWFDSVYQAVEAEVGEIDSWWMKFKYNVIV